MLKDYTLPQGCPSDDEAHDVADCNDPEHNILAGKSGLVLVRHRFSVTQGEVAVRYDGRDLGRYGDTIAMRELEAGAEDIAGWSGRGDLFWAGVALRALANEVAYWQADGEAQVAVIARLAGRNAAIRAKACSIVDGDHDSVDDDRYAAGAILALLDGKSVEG